jgi:hypothetical protein
MPIEKVLIEYAKLHIQLIIAQEKIAQLEAQIKASTPQPAQTATTEKQ